LRASSATGTELGAIAPVALVVDDDVAMRLLIRQTLERLGFACHEADNGIAALERFDQIAPDIVLLDVVMPGMNGYALCSELRRRPTGAFVPILMLTGLDDPDSINRAYEVGATDFISKPINWGILGHRIRYILRANQAFSDLEKNRESLENAQRIAHLGSWEWELPRDTVRWSDETYRILGVAPGGVAPSLSAFLYHVHPDDRHAIQESMRRLLKMREFVGQVVRIRRHDGSVRHAQLQGVRHLDSAGSVTRLSGTIQDVTEIKQAEERIRHLAYYDGITGLPNRQFFIERLQQALVHAKRYQRLLGLLSLDLDQFKRINDTLGHSAGNELLLSVSQRLSDAVRAPDTFAHDGKETAFGRDVGSTVARLGGDEFSLLITELTHYHDAAKVARRLLEELRKPFRVAKQEVFVSVSVGLALYPLDGDDAETLIKNAGAAMHFAKDQGRDNYQFYSRAMNATALEKLSMEAQLRKALERDELLLHYQPKIRPKTGEIVGLEALIRWKHPELGLVPPAQFIPLAEETGLIVPIGEWVLLNACRQNQDWQRLGYPPVHVAVNIASLHFRQGTLGQSVATALQKSGLHPSWLELEVTESMLMDSAETTLATLSTLKGMGVRLAIDDFGTGYSSLSYLKRFPLDALKIDRSFVKDLPRDAEDAAIAKAIIAMAHSLKLEVVAEGVETAEQLAFLQQHGCDLVQGFLFGKPVAAAALHDLLSGKKLKTAAGGR
jgi:diguanylate cyclase (GGDEF)-like protein/PAS domain S-box-containing protein